MRKNGGIVMAKRKICEVVKFFAKLSVAFVRVDESELAFIKVSRTFVKSFYNKLKGRLCLKNVTFNTSGQWYKFLCLKF
jgi:hypothetical protein